MTKQMHYLGALLLVPSILSCASSANRPEEPAAAEPSCVLLLHLKESQHRATEPIDGRLTIENIGGDPIVIVKPIVPTGWSVRFVPEQGSIDAAQVWEGSVLRGTPDRGHEPVYGPSDYVTVASGEVYEQDLDVAWFLRNQRSRIPLGIYELRVWYRHHPQLAELRRIPGVFPPETISNVLRVVITDDAE